MTWELASETGIRRSLSCRHACCAIALSLTHDFTLPSSPWREVAAGVFSAFWVRRSSGPSRCSPLAVLGEDVIVVLHDGVAGKAALCVMFLRRFVGFVGRPECCGRGIVLERAVSPSAAVGEPLAVLHHEIDIVLGVRHRRLAGVSLLLFRAPVN